MQGRGGGVRPREGGHRGDHHGFVDALANFDDGGLPAFGATELDFRVFRHDRIVQQMLLPAMDTTGLHTVKLARREPGEWAA